MTTGDLAAQDQDLLCPLCEYNLRGLMEPRCPECGYRSTWAELRKVHERHPYLFEHHPRRNFWSLLRTLWGAMWPSRFWTSISPQQKPVVGRLIVYISLTSLVAAGSASVNFWLDLVETRRWLATGFMMRQFLFRYGGLETLVLPAMLLLWAPLTFCSLLIFRISMQRARIKVGHVLRCVAYSGDILILFLPLFLLLALRRIHQFGFGGFLQNRLHAADLLYLIVFMEWLLIYRLYVSYRGYLRFDHPFATVLASQIIVALVMFKLALMGAGY